MQLIDRTTATESPLHAVPWQDSKPQAFTHLFVQATPNPNQLARQFSGSPMQKKQKTRKPYFGKIKRRPIASKSQQNRAANIGQTNSTESSSRSGEMSNSPKATIADFKDILPIFSADKPIIEIHSGTQITRISNISILQGACEAASRHITQELLGKKWHELLPIGHDLTINDLEKFVLEEVGTEWTVFSQFRYKNGDIRIVTSNPSTPTLESKSRALTIVKMTIGELLFEDSKVNPENRIVERTILVDQTPMVMTSAELLNEYKNTSEQDRKFNFITVDTIFQQYAKKLGGSITMEKLANLNSEDLSMFYANANMALALGIRKWPFD